MTFKRVDKNQNEVVRAFRASNFSVAITSMLGHGFPDLVIGANLGALRGKYTALVEIKDGSKPLSAQKLTPDEVKFKENWSGNYHIIRSVADVAVLVESLMKGE
jgi:hypothetical protein